MSEKIETGMAPVVLDVSERWSAEPADDLPSVQDVLESAGLQYLETVDAPDVAPAMPTYVVPVPIFRHIQRYDREAAALLARRQEHMDLAVEMLGIDTVTYHPIIDLDTGVVTLTPRSELPS